jgi:hypothetical protein
MISEGEEEVTQKLDSWVEDEGKSVVKENENEKELNFVPKFKLETVDTVRVNSYEKELNDNVIDCFIE